jgi:division/cell wall cluster transcriptional repressor MraZ
VTHSIPHTIDAKGRCSIPATFRDELMAIAEDAPMVLVWSPIGDCLSLYSQKAWRPYEEKLNRIDDFDVDRVAVKDTMLACQMKIDPKNLGERLLIPEGLREMAGLKKDVVFNMRAHVLQIWDKARWQRSEEHTSELQSP